MNTLTEAWNISEDGIIGYYVYRTPAFTSGASNVTIDAAQITSSFHNRRYIDTDVFLGNTYAYQVRPFASNGTRSFSESPLSPTFNFTAVLNGKSRGGDDEKTMTMAYIAAGSAGGVALAIIIFAVLYFTSCCSKKKKGGPQVSDVEMNKKPDDEK